MALTRLIPIVTVVGFLSALLMTMQTLTPPKAVQRPAEAILKADRLEPKEIRVIPITRSWPTAAAALTPAAEPEPTPKQRVAMADPLTMPAEPVKEETDDVRPARRHYSDICAAHGMRKVERGRGWRCVHARR